MKGRQSTNSETIWPQRLQQSSRLTGGLALALLLAATAWAETAPPAPLAGEAHSGERLVRQSASLLASIISSTCLLFKSNKISRASHCSSFPISTSTRHRPCRLRWLRVAVR